jgi:parvulin-like peptidyl-prolyl isomerase
MVLWVWCGAVWIHAATPRKVDQIYLVVDQEAMTKGELDEEIVGFFGAQGMKPPAPGSAEYEQVKKQVREAFIREVLLAEAADREKVEVPDAEVDQAVDTEFGNMKKRYPTEDDFEAALKKEGLTSDDLKQEIHDQLLRRLKANRMVQFKQREAPGATFVTDEEMQAYYRKHPKDFEQVKFSLILFRIPPKSTAAYIKEVQKQAQDLLEQLKKGADFAAFAKKYSEDPATSEKGGQMDPVYRVDLNPKMANGLFAIPVHGLGLVRSEDGFYLVRVESKKSGDLDTVSSAIKEHLRRKKQGGAFEKWMENLRKNATVLEDGKVVAYLPPTEKKAESEEVDDQNNKTTAPAASAPVTSDGAPGTVASSETPSPKKAIYPTLPPPGLLALELGAEGFSFGNKDLSNFYGPGIDVTQNFPFGFGLGAALDLAVDPTFEIGLTVRSLTRTGQTVNFAPVNQNPYREIWSASAAGPGVEGKILIPLDESTNFNLTAGGGYYFILGGGVSVTGQSVLENANFSGSNFGGEASGTVEFFLDGNMDAALDLTLGYRFLQITPVTTNLTVNTGGPYNTFPSPLTNGDGSQGVVDFSGPKAGFSIRFYIDKNG